MLKMKRNKGITLIALVITIVVLLILAGVSIAMLTGENGILNQAQETKEQTEYKSAEEKVKLAIMGAMADGGTLTVSKLSTELSYQGGSLKGTSFPITVQVDGRDFLVQGNGTVNNAIISKSDAYVGYYADIEGDGTVDGIIYADLAKGNTKSGNWGGFSKAYNIPVVEGVKDYYISQTNYNGKFGSKDVLSPVGTGKERFYVMALTDIDKKQNGAEYTWYKSITTSMTDYATTTSTNFGKGKENTNAMIAKWNSNGYGEQSTSDLWGIIKTSVAKGWFVPSMEEWTAFAGELEITKGNYENKGLSVWCWSSSQISETKVYDVYFAQGYISNANPNSPGRVRLTTIM